MNDDGPLLLVHGSLLDYICLGMMLSAAFTSFLGIQASFISRTTAGMSINR